MQYTIDLFIRVEASGKYSMMTVLVVVFRCKNYENNQDQDAMFAMQCTRGAVDLT